MNQIYDNTNMTMKFTLFRSAFFIVVKMLYLLKFEQIKKRLTGISRGVRQANISNKDILNLVVPIPPMEIQNQFAEFVKQVDKSKVAVQKSLDETQRLFDSLMQEYFG